MALIGIRKSFHHLHQTLHGNPSKIMLPCQVWELHMFLFFLLISTTTIPGKIIQIYQLFFFFFFRKIRSTNYLVIMILISCFGWHPNTREHFLHLAMACLQITYPIAQSRNPPSLPFHLANLTPKPYPHNPFFLEWSLTSQLCGSNNHSLDHLNQLQTF